MGKTPEANKVVVLGGGFAAYRFARELGKTGLDVTLVSPRNHFLFTPLLPSTTVGTLEFRSIIEPLRGQDAASFLLASAVSLDAGKRTVRCASPLDGRETELPYDDLVIAVGAVPGTFGIPGVAEHALFLKEIADARHIRRRVLDCLERAASPGLPADAQQKLLTFVVVGGGPTGVEFAAELHDFLMKDLSEAYPDLVPKVRILVVEAGASLLEAFDRKLSDYAARRFRRARIEVRTQARVVRVTADHVDLKDGEPLPYGLLVWATGNAPTSFVHSLPLPKDARGRLLIGPDLKVKGEEHLYALGDCSLLEADPLPATAQVAEQQGHYLAKAFRARLKGKPVAPFTFKNMGMLAYVGGHRAIADLPGVKGSGFFTFLFWRSVYLTKLVGFRNKLLVFFDWFKATFLGRDLSRI